MLVLSRRPGEVIEIGGGIRMTVVKLGRNRVSIGIDAPPDVLIRRQELAERQAGRAGRRVRELVAC